MNSSGSRKFCYPVCLPCRVAECPKAVLITDPEPGVIRRDRLEGTRLACGCLCELPIVLGVLNPTHVKCARHGWQPIEKRKRNLPSKGGTGKKDIGGSQIRPWEPGINVGRIPGRCSCTWNLQGGKWWLKFRHQSCLAREEHG